MFTSQPQTRDRQSRQRQAQVKVPFMVVRFPTLHLAFDMTQLQRVLPMPVVQYNQSQLLGLARLDLAQSGTEEAHPVIVVDLHRKLYDGSLEQPSHLLIFKADDGLLYGIPVPALPEIVAVTADLLGDEEASMTEPPVVGITRQVVKLSVPGGEKMLFIVDVNSVAREIRNLAMTC